LDHGESASRNGGLERGGIQANAALQAFKKGEKRATSYPAVVKSGGVFKPPKKIGLGAGEAEKYSAGGERVKKTFVSHQRGKKERHTSICNGKGWKSELH